MGFTDSFMNTLLDEYWGDQSPDTPPGIWYVGLFTTLPANDGTGGVEAAFSGYARVASTNDLTEWPAAAAGVKSNANTVDFGVAGSGPESMVGVGFWDDPTAGNLWWFDSLTGEPILVSLGTPVSFGAGAIQLLRC